MKILKSIWIISERAISVALRRAGVASDRSHGSRSSDPVDGQPSFITAHTESNQFPKENEHRKESHELQYQCVVCDIWLLTPRALGAHYLEGHDNTPSIGGSINRVNGVGGIECPDCQLEVEFVREQVFHRIRTHKAKSIT